jgi:hypothetical protein
MSGLEALLKYPTAARQGDRFVVAKVIPATLGSVTKNEIAITTSQKAYNKAVAEGPAREAYLDSKGLVHVTATVTVKGGFVVAITSNRNGTFVTPHNGDVSGELNWSYSYGRFNSSAPVVAPPANELLDNSAGGSFSTASKDASCATGAIGQSVGGVTAAVQNQYLSLSQPLLAANDAFVAAVIPHYKTTSNPDAKRLSAPLVSVLSTANGELRDDRWPTGVQPSIDALIKARNRFITDIEDLPSTGDVTTAWTKKLYNDGASAGNIDETILHELGLPMSDSS